MKSSFFSGVTFLLCFGVLFIKSTEGMIAIHRGPVQQRSISDSEDGEIFETGDSGTVNNGLKCYNNLDSSFLQCKRHKDKLSVDCPALNSTLSINMFVKNSTVECPSIMTNFNGTSNQTIPHQGVCLRFTWQKNGGTKMTGNTCWDEKMATEAFTFKKGEHTASLKPGDYMAKMDVKKNKNTVFTFTDITACNDHRKTPCNEGGRATPPATIAVFIAIAIAGILGAY